MLSKEYETTLAKCSLFRGMSGSERQELLALLEPKSYPPASSIFAEGESTQFIWIVLRGRCQVLRKYQSGQETELGIIEPYGIFGELSFFQPAPHSASIRAVSEVEVVRLPREKYDQLLRNGSLAAYKLAFNTVGVVIEKIRHMDHRIADRLQRNSAPEHHEEWKEFQAKLYTGWSF
jgi:CRP-like cAMP-binding protein